MTTFDRYTHLPDERVREALTALELFIGDMDGAEVDDGTIDSENAVKAFNVVVAALALHQQHPAPPSVTADDGHDYPSTPGYFVVMAILDWWDEVGNEEEPACITRARRFLKTAAAHTAHDRQRIPQELRDLVSAWDALPSGHYRPGQVERWMRENMKPAIDRARSLIAEERDGQ